MKKWSCQYASMLRICFDVAYILRCGPKFRLHVTAPLRRFAEWPLPPRTHQEKKPLRNNVQVEGEEECGGMEWWWSRGYINRRRNYKLLQKPDSDITRKRSCLTTVNPLCWLLKEESLLLLGRRCCCRHLKRTFPDPKAIKEKPFR